MRFELLLVLVFASFGVNAEQNRDLSLAEALLEAKIESCSKLKSRDIEITDDWLKSQPLSIQKVVIFDVLKNAEVNCTKSEEVNYRAVLVELAINGDNRPLDEYIFLRKQGKLDKPYLDLLQSVDQSQLIRLKAMPKYQSPFNVLSAF